MKINLGWNQGKLCKNALISDQCLKGLSCFIDLRKALVTICHKTMIKKLEKYGFRGNFLNLMKCFLENRHQYVEYNISVGQKFQIKLWRSQGSVLGSLFFLLYINDLPKGCKSIKSSLFAEYTTIHSATKQNASFFYNEVKETMWWFKEHKLTIDDKEAASRISEEAKTWTKIF